MVKSVLPRQLELLGQRLSEVWKAVGQPLPNAFSPETLLVFRHEYRRLDDQLIKGGKTSRQRALFLILICLGRYPSGTEIQYWASELDVAGLDPTLERISELREFKLLLRSRNQVFLEALRAKPVLMDVSFTVAYPYNTGIQRVVRQLASELQKRERDFRLFTWKDGCPAFASADEQGKIFDFKTFGSKQYTAKENLNWAGKRLLRLPLRILRAFASDAAVVALRVYHRLRENVMIPWAERTASARTAFRFFESAKPGLRKIKRFAVEQMNGLPSLSKENNRTMPILFGVPLLLAEVPLENERIERYLALGMARACKFQMIVYDLIPLLTPEYCVGVSDGFVDYLRLFREADGICCISESVMKDVEALMKSVLREKAGPLLSFSHLGANFVESHAGPENALAPLILSVGTIEPRKNQIQLLRAAHVLRQRGLKFKVVFVGNPGWKSDEFYAELSRLDPHQEFASIRYSVSDRELDQLYRQCRFSVFCSHFEGFGLPILESLHYGKPVITSPIGSMKEVADRFGGCVLVSPNDLSGMVEAMALLLSNDAELAKLAASIRQVRAATWAEYADRVFEVMGRC